MGCTGSKYQALSAENSSTATSPAENASGGSATAQPQTPPAEPHTPDRPTTPPSQTPTLTTPGTSRESDVGPPPWGAGARNQPAAVPEFEPPLVENAGDD